MCQAPIGAHRVSFPAPLFRTHLSTPGPDVRIPIEPPAAHRRQAASPCATGPALFQRLVDLVSPGPDSRDELIETLADAENKELIAPESRMMLEGVIRMADLTAGDVMVAAPRMDLLDIDAAYEELLNDVISTGHSRFPVYEGRRENVIGILMAKDLLKLQRSPDLNLRTLLRPAVFVPESKGLNELLRDFRANRNHLAIVIDEFGNTAGSDHDRGRARGDRRRDRGRVRREGRRVRHLHAGRRQPARRRRRDIDGGERGLRRRRCRPTSSRPSAAWSPTSSGRVPRRGESVTVGGLVFTVMLTRGGAVRWFKVTRARRGGGRVRRRLSGASAGRATARGAGRDPPSRRPALALDAALVAAARRAAHLRLRRHPACGRCSSLAVALLAWRVAPAVAAACGLLGFAFGTAWLGAGTWWLFVSMHRYGGLPAWLAALAVLRCCAAFLSLYLAAAMAAFARWRPRRRRGAMRRCSPPCWLLAELARGVDLHRLSVGRERLRAGRFAARRLRAVGRRLRHRRDRRRRSRPGSAFALAAACAAAGWRCAGSALVLLGGGASLGRPDFTDADAGAERHAAAGQRAAGREVRGRSTSPRRCRGRAAQLLAARGELVVAPETVDPVAAGAARRRRTGTPLLRAFQRGDQRRAPRPAAGRRRGRLHQFGGRHLGATAPLPDGYYRYDKHHLVPFGEFIPHGFHWFTRLMNIPLGDFNRGAADGAVVRVRRRAHRAEHLLRRPVRRGAGGALRRPGRGADDLRQPRATSAGSATRSRSTSTCTSRACARWSSQRPMLRATNTGATAVIDHHGVVTACAAAVHAGRRSTATVEGRQRPDAVRALGRALRPVAAVGARPGARRRRLAAAARADP